MSPHSDGEDPSGSKNRKYAIAKGGIYSQEKYKPYIKENYKRLSIENSSHEYIVYCESTEQEKIGNKNPILLTNMLTDNLKGIAGVHRINAHKIGVTFKKAGAANNFLKMEEFLLKHKMKAFISSYLTEKIGVLKFVPADLGNEDIYKNILSDAEVISIRRFMRKVKENLYH